MRIIDLEKRVEQTVLQRMNIYSLAKCLGIVNCRIRPTKRGTKGVKKRRIPIVITVLRPPKPPGQYGSNGNNLKVQLPTDTLPSHVTCMLLNTQSLCNKALTVREHMLDYEADIRFLRWPPVSDNRGKCVCENYFVEYPNRLTK